MWLLEVFSSGISKSLSMNASKHFSVQVESDFSEHEHFYFSSPYLDTIDVGDSNLAFFRAKAMIRILNGILELNGQPVVAFNSDRILFSLNGEKKSSHRTDFNSQLEYEALQNPFEIGTLQPVIFNFTPKVNDTKVDVVDLFDLAYKEDLVRESLILFSLSKIEPLYSLMNTAKIVETIEFDLGIPSKGGERKNKINELKGVGNEGLSEDFWIAHNFFNKKAPGSFFHFINTRDGSGIFARHGATSQKYDSKLPIISFEEIEYNIRILIYEWANYKLIKFKGYRYPPIKRVSKIEDLKDEKFISGFDLF